MIEKLEFKEDDFDSSLDYAHPESKKGSMAPGAQRKRAQKKFDEWFDKNLIIQRPVYLRWEHNQPVEVSRTRDVVVHTSKGYIVGIEELSPCTHRSSKVIKRLELGYDLGGIAETLTVYHCGECKIKLQPKEYEAFKE